MQFITTGNRIAVENFVLGDLYTITFTSGRYINSACIGIGENFVSFQRNEPELLFTLNMETAELVISIDLYAGGTGTNNYNELSNKPQIGGVELVGNKSLSDLGIQAEITEESPLSSSLVSGLGSAAAADSSDFATAAQGALAETAIQSAGTGLTKDGTTLNHSNSVTAQTSASFSSITFDAQGHITGSTAATTAQLNAINSGITSTDVAQIETNKTNILSVADYGAKNIFNPTITSGTYYGLDITVNADKTITINNTTPLSESKYIILGTAIPTLAGTYTFDGTPSGITVDTGGYMRIEQGSAGVSQILTPVDITLNTSQTYTVFLRILAGKTYSNVTLKPLLCLKSLYEASPTYQPYAMSNAELTPSTQIKTHNFSAANTLENTGLSFTIGAGTTYLLTASISWDSGEPLAILLSTASDASSVTRYNTWAISEVTTGEGRTMLTCIALISNTSSSETYNCFVKNVSATGRSKVTLSAKRLL